MSRLAIPGRAVPRRFPVLALAALAACAGAEGAVPEPGPVVTLAETGGSRPTVAVDAASGRGYVAWVGTEDGVANVYLAVHDPRGAAPAAPVRVNDRPGDAAPHEQAPAQVRVGPEGNLYVLWQNNARIEGRRFPASDLRLAVSTDGGRSFRPAVSVNDDAGGPLSSHSFQDIAVAADGAVYVAWIDSRVRDAARASRPPSEAGHAGHDAHGDEEGLPGPEIRVARSTDGGLTFGPSVVVDGDACPCCRTAIAAGPDGSVYVAWRKRFAGEVRDVVVARSAPGALAFSEPVPAHHDGWVFPGCPHAGPALAVDGRGRVHVAWYTGREGRQGLWYASSADDGRSFRAPQALLTDGWVPPSQAQLVVSGGEVWAAWDDRRQEDGTLALAVMNASGRFVRVLPSSHRGASPALDGSRAGTLVAWSEGEAVRARWIGGGHAEY
jgi:hypothetical protein